LQLPKTCKVNFATTKNPPLVPLFQRGRRRGGFKSKAKALPYRRLFAKDFDWRWNIICRAKAMLYIYKEIFQNYLLLYFSSITFMKGLLLKLSKRRTLIIEVDCYGRLNY
jgi:hypothetical protein